jgi:ATP-dependent DNA helicase RecG
VPIYPQSDKAGLTSWELADFVEEALQRAGRLVDPLPEPWRRRLHLQDRTDAMSCVHAPPSMEAAWPARHRLAFDELLRLQCVLVMRKRAMERQARGIRHPVGGGEGGEGVVAEFRRRLPFTLTGAQEGAIAEISADLSSDQPMHRLLQGDVGAGKTVVAVTALLAAVEGGRQGALMAPTEVLAEQHHLGVRELVEGLTVPDPGRLTGTRPLRVELLTNRTTQAERAQLHARLRSGEADILVGTHALLTEQVSFRSLGVVVIDEQHRFGVEQRAVLREKGEADGATPDVLVMTATPIPRTAAMTVFGDLDVTVLDERPPGRSPAQTTWARGPLDVVAAWSKVRAEVDAGRRAYVVCPLVEESERIEAASATEEHRRLGDNELAGLRLGLLHGQMASSEKEEVMGKFRAGELDVLVTTTVIEVGVDVREATVMVIEDAERFGMAQLHQLRGRVGRGSDPSWCFLLGEASTPEAEQRLMALERSSDGFELAEVDLELRGEGTILGTRQTGRNDLKLASLRRDKELVTRAREVAFDLVDSSPGLAGFPLLAEEVRLFVDPEEEDFLFKS